MRPRAGTKTGPEHEKGERGDRGDRARRNVAWVRWLPLVLVVIPIIFNLWVLRAELNPVLNPNDTSVHTSMVHWAEQQIDEGNIPLDGWYPDLSLGLPQFHHYQSLPHITAAYIGEIVGTDRIIQWSLYVLLAFWPLSIYWCGRLFGFDRWAAAAMALVSPLLHSVTGYGYEHASYLWRGNGIWSQLWGMWLLPLALGLSWRAVTKGKGFALAALAVALTVAYHFLTGYLALLALGVWVVVKPSEWKRRIPRTAVVGIGSVLAASWVIVPLLTDSAWANQSEFNKDTIWSNSFGAGKVLGWLAGGDLLDFERWPVVTALAAAGLVVAIVRCREHERYRGILVFTGLSLLLFFGRPTFGPLLNLFPGGKDLLLHRYIMGVHLGAVLFAGIGLAWLMQRLIAFLAPQSREPRVTLVTIGAMALAVAVLLPAWLDIRNYAGTNAQWIREQVQHDRTDGQTVKELVDQATALGGGRIYAGMANGWGPEYRVGRVPVYAALLTNDADAIGFTIRTVSLTTDIEARFDETNPAHYDLFNVRYLILPSWKKPAVPATLLRSLDGNDLYQVDTTGYLDVVDTVAPAIVGDRTNLGQQSEAFLGSPSLADKLFPAVAFGGSSAPLPTVALGGVVEGRAGSVSVQYDQPDDGVFGGRVVAKRPAVVLLKASHHPRWKVTVDGRAATPIMVAPSFVGVEVPAGAHTVEFRYERYPYYPYLFGVGLLALLALALVPRFVPLAQRILGPPNSAGPRHRLGSHRYIALPTDSRTPDLP